MRPRRHEPVTSSTETGRIGAGADEPACVAVVLKGYPRLSETFIAQELKALEERGMRLSLVSLRRPTDPTIHPIHREIHADCLYLPEYVLREPVRVLRGLCHALFALRVRPVLSAFFRDLVRDPTPNRVRRLAQALVLARELPPGCRLIYAHFMHTPASVARYASMLVGRPFAISAHAKDIWTLPGWEKREKLAEAEFTVTCTAANASHLESLARFPDRVHRAYHGIDLDRFTDPGRRDDDADGSRARPLTILSVGRAVPKKGYPVLLAALALLPSTLKWRFVHVGGGPELGRLAVDAERLGIADRVQWLGPAPQDEVLAHYRGASLFVLASVITADGDRDGLPNVLMEAQSQRVCCIASNISAIPEIVTDGDTGCLVPANDASVLAAAIERLGTDPALRRRMAARAVERLHERFSAGHEIGRVHALLNAP